MLIGNLTETCLLWLWTVFINWYYWIICELYNFKAGWENSFLAHYVEKRRISKIRNLVKYIKKKKKIYLVTKKKSYKKNEWKDVRAQLTRNNLNTHML